MAMPKDNDPDPGRSRERRDQDRLLDRTADEESWLARLWRHHFGTKGRPDPGNRRDGKRR
jgi:hypothetical protein